MTSGDTQRNATRNRWRIWWLTIILLSWLRSQHTKEASNSEQSDEHCVQRDAGEADGKPDILTLIRDDLKWWFPSSLVVASASAVVLVYIAQRYYGTFYMAFGLDPVQAGVTQADTLFRILPIVVVLGLVTLLVRTLWLASRAQGSADSRSVKNPKARWWRRFGVPVVTVLLCPITLVGAAAWANVAMGAGADDAREVITLRYNYVYSSFWQQGSARRRWWSP
jgi:hypothetical protein